MAGVEVPNPEVPNPGVDAETFYIMFCFAYRSIYLRLSSMLGPHLDYTVSVFFKSES